MVAKPLAKVSELQPILILVDGLDEADRFDGPTRLADLIADMRTSAPSVRFILSTRLPDVLAKRLGPERTCIWDLSAGAGLAGERAGGDVCGRAAGGLLGATLVAGADHDRHAGLAEPERQAESERSGATDDAHG